MRLSLHLSHSYWSRSISLETIGMPNNAFLLAPAKSLVAASPSMQSRPIEGLQMLESAEPIRLLTALSYSEYPADLPALQDLG